MKIAVYGAGAVGSVIGARLALAGEDVTLLARGAHLTALRENGLRVHSRVFGELSCRPAATDDPDEIGPVDLILLTVKAHSIAAVAPRIPAMLQNHTVVVPLQNGFPWWYFHKLGAPWGNFRLEATDPGGVIARHIPIGHVIGGLAYCVAHMTAPGIIEHLDSVRFPIGELDATRSERLLRVSELFKKAGMQAPPRVDIRRETWTKLLGNVPFNPLSALTRADLAQLLGCPLTRQLAFDVMEETRSVAAKLGVRISITSEQRMAGAGKVGPHKTSMLQDLEAGRDPELEPITGAIVELADKLGVPAPNLRAVHACAKLLFEVERQRRSAATKS